MDEHNHLSSSIPSSNSHSLFNTTLKPNDSSSSGKFLAVPGKNSFLNLSSHNTGNGNRYFESLLVKQAILICIIMVTSIPYKNDTYNHIFDKLNACIVKV